MNEVELLKNLNHKNIVKYLGSLRSKTHLVSGGSTLDPPALLLSLSSLLFLLFDWGTT